MPRIDAVDLSHWNTVTDFGALAKSGVIGVIQKATEGTGYIDPTYASRKDQATKAGLAWSAYHFLKHGDVQKQMQWFFDKASLPPWSRWAIDYEDTACTLDDLKQSLEVLTGLDPTAQICVYAGGLLKGQVGSNKYPWLEPYSLWLAQYTSGAPSWPKQIWPSYALWQYTDKGTVAGVTGAVDCNTFNGSPDNCAKWFGPTEPSPGPSPDPELKSVNIDITIPDGVNVTVTVNGDAIT